MGLKIRLYVKSESTIEGERQRVAMSSTVLLDTGKTYLDASDSSSCMAV